MRYDARIAALALPAVLACTAAGGSESAWTGTLDTLDNGVVAVTNPETPVWDEATAWTVREELRIGALEGDGPEVFGSISYLAVDPLGRLWVMEGQAQELRVFDAAGNHVRTIGRKGGGPGEFARALALQWAPDGTLWIPDPQNNRISVFDTAGRLVTVKPSPGGFVIRPWPGGFDRRGGYHSPVLRQVAGEFQLGLVRYDTALTPGDTVPPPVRFGDGERFELRRGNSSMVVSVPFTPSVRWQFHASGTFWVMETGSYRLAQLSMTHDTLRTITKAFDPVPVRDTDIDAAIANLEWFTRQGGKIDRSRFPSVKPATDDFYIDDEGNIWVEPITGAPDDTVFDVFDPEGRYLGRLALPFPLWENVAPVFRNGTLYAVTLDELEVPYVIRARIEKP